MLASPLDGRGRWCRARRTSCVSIERADHGGAATIAALAAGCWHQNRAHSGWVHVMIYQRR